MAGLVPPTARSSPAQEEGNSNADAIVVRSSVGEATKRGRRSKFTPQDDVIIPLLVLQNSQPVQFGGSIDKFSLLQN